MRFFKKEQIALLQSSILPHPPSNARLVQVVRRNFHLYAVADSQPHPAFSHFAANRRQHDVLVGQLNAEHRPGEDNHYDAFYFNVLFFCMCHSFFLEGLSKHEARGRADHPGASSKKRTRPGLTQTSFPGCKADISDCARRYIRVDRRRRTRDHHHHRCALRAVWRR
jgi:hypothetical protein